jgi:DNA invertase Pin-like site-specific DNA recombinase
MEAQKQRLEEECSRRGWDPVFVCEVESAKNLQRPRLQKVLSDIQAGDVLISAKLDRLSRSVYDFSSLMADSTKSEWEIVLLEPSVDTTTPHGKFTANIFAAVAELERELISQRTKEALAVLKQKGIKLGSPKQIPDNVEHRIISERASGFTLREIAEGLEMDQVPTVKGGRWEVSSIQRVLKRAGL